MKTKLDKSKAVRHRLSVEVSVDTLKGSVERALKKIQKEAAIKGFRKGAVPLDVLKKYLGHDAEKEIIKQIVSDTYVAALQKEDSKPISDPFIEHEVYEEGKSFTYHATFDVMPEIISPLYEGIDLEKEKVEVSEKEIESSLVRLQHSMTQLEPAANAEFKNGMVATIDFKGTAGGKSFKGSEAKDFFADYGYMLPEFEKAIEGMKAGEDKDVHFKYPDTYFNKEVAGKEAVFHVKVKDVKKKILPELNDDFAKSVGKFRSMNDLKEEVKKQITGMKEDYQRQKMAADAIKKLVEKNKIDVPEVMVNDELRLMLEDIARRLKIEGRSLEQAGIEPREFVKRHYEEAADRVRGYLIALTIAKKESLDVTDKEVDDRLAAISKQSGQTMEEIRKRLSQKGSMEGLRSQILYEKTLGLIVSKARVKEIKAKKRK